MTMSANHSVTFLCDSLKLSCVQGFSLHKGEDTHLHAAWTAEAICRARELDDGTVKGLTLEEFRTQLGLLTAF
jgi:hypothetical protein